MQSYFMINDEQDDECQLFMDENLSIAFQKKILTNQTKKGVDNISFLPYQPTYSDIDSSQLNNPNMKICQQIWQKQSQQQQILAIKCIKYHETPPRNLKLSKKPKKSSNIFKNNDSKENDLSNQIDKITINKQIREITSNQEKVLQQVSQNQQTDEEKNNQKLKFKSAFKLFKLDKIAEVKRSNPEFDFRQRTQHLKSLWKELSPEQKLEYVKKSRIEKQKAVEDQIFDERNSQKDKD